MTEIETQAAYFLDKYTEPILGGKWDYTITTVPSTEIGVATNGEPGLATNKVWPGERRMELSLNGDADWVHQNAELTVVHELIHAVFMMMGYDAARGVAQEEFAAVSPIAAGAHHKTTQLLLEECIDRIAYAIIHGQDSDGAADTA